MRACHNPPMAFFQILRRLRQWNEQFLSRLLKFFERIPPSFRVSRVCRTFSPRTMLGAYHFLSFFFEKSVNTHTKPSNQMQCLSESCGGSNLFLESVRIAIRVVMLLFTEFFTAFKCPLLLPVISYYFC